MRTVESIRYMTSSELTIDSKEISEEFSHLEQEKIEELASRNEDTGKLSFLSEFQGKQNAKIIGVNVKETRRTDSKNIRIKMKAEDGIHKTRIKNTREYNQKNPFVRFLNYYDIPLSQPSELIGKEVELINKRRTWRLFYPDSLDRFTLLSNKIKMYARSLLGIKFLWKMKPAEIIVSVFTTWLFSSLLTLPLTGAVSESIGFGRTPLYLLSTIVLILSSWTLYRSYCVMKRRVRRMKKKDRVPRRN